MAWLNRVEVKRSSCFLLARKWLVFSRLLMLIPLRLLFRISVVTRKTADEKATNSTFEHCVPVILFYKAISILY